MGDVRPVHLGRGYYAVTEPYPYGGRFKLGWSHGRVDTQQAFCLCEQ